MFFTTITLLHKLFNLGFSKDEIDEMVKDYFQDNNKTYLFNEPEYNIFPCNLSIDQILEKAYDEKEKKQKKMKEQEIKRLIDMEVLTPKEREKIVGNHNKSQQEIK